MAITSGVPNDRVRLEEDDRNELIRLAQENDRYLTQEYRRAVKFYIAAMRQAENRIKGKT